MSQSLLSAGQNRPDVNENVLLWNIYLALTGGVPGTPTVPTFVGGAGGIAIPASDYVAYTYYGSTNNIQTATYKTGGSGGTTVATLTFTYVGSGVANDDKIATITKT